MRIKHILALILFPFLLACAAPENGPLVPPPAPGPGEDTNPGGDDPNPNPGGDTPGTNPGTPGEYVVIGYATYWESTMPDPSLLTHINYAFGKIGSDFETLKINTDSRLKKLVGLKKTNPSLKVLLSIGGWGAGNFSEMAADESHRKKFCENCLKAVNQYGLDGIDLDWEYPTSSSAGISSSPDDTKNFTLLVKDLRATLGDGLLITMASSANAKYVNFKDFIDYMDWVNLMTYDMGNPPYHNAGLYKSAMTKRSCDESVALHYTAGVPYEKIVLGMPFYGRDDHNAFTAGDDDNYVYYHDITAGSYVERWDSQALVPYLTNAAGTMVLSYDNEQSISLKANYIKDKGLKGAMYWAIEGDDSNWTLSKAIAGPLLGWNAGNEDGTIPSYAVTNAYVQAYMDGVNYTDWDFSGTQILNYEGGGPGEADIPPYVEIKWNATGTGKQTLKLWDDSWSREWSLDAGVSSQSVTNLAPGHYHYQITDASSSIVDKGEFKATGALHQVYFEKDTRNGRSLGGLKTLDGKTVRHWLLYRGGKASSIKDAGKKEAAAVGIKAELDLREADPSQTTSYFGSGVAYLRPGFGSSENYRTMLRDCSERVKASFEFIVDNLRKGNPVYFHCAAGRDRTGTIAALCLGLLGVREGDIAKDYELTYFSPDDWSMSGPDDARYYDHTRHVSSYKNCVQYLRDQDTGSSKTLKKGAETYLRNIGVSQQDIDDFRTIMLK